VETRGENFYDPEKIRPVTDARFWAEFMSGFSRAFFCLSGPKGRTDDSKGLRSRSRSSGRAGGRTLGGRAREADL
jgi:hypothetical protein